MATLILDAEVFAPEPRGRADLLVVGDRILRLEPGLRPREDLLALLDCEVVPAAGLLALPGLVDGHVHLLGGGGEGGPRTRAPELSPSALAAAGITTVVGLLGFDGVTRHVVSLLSKAHALDEDGFSTRIYTGAYELPVQTVTGSVERDLVLIDKVIGVGEVAIADHRSSCPTARELARLAASSQIGGTLGGKPGLLHVHVGGGAEGLALLWEVLELSHLPVRCLYPTHINRSPRLLDEAAAFSRRGACVDLTATVGPDCDEPGSLAPEEALPRLLASGAPPERVTLSSDGNGSLPSFDAAGNLVGISVGSVTLLWERVRRAVLLRGLPLPLALACVTANPARVLGLPRKGRLAPGQDADLLLVRPDLSIERVLAGGRWVWIDGQSRVADPFAAAPAPR